MDSGSCFLGGEWMTGMGEQLRGRLILFLV